MSAKNLQELQRQQEANAIAIERLRRQQQTQNMRQVEREEEDEYVPPEPQHQPQPRYKEVSPEQIAMQVQDKVMKSIQNYSEVEATVKKRMNRLIEEYPALTDETSPFVAKAREEYQRIAAENPALDEATRYELSVKSAASLLGARPVNAPMDLNSDFVMPANSNPGALRANRKTKSRLTTPILQNFKLMTQGRADASLDPNTVEGRKNLAELEDSTDRFNADVDESHLKYR